MNFSTNHKTIFMTGATSGLGKISALKAESNGATLIILAKNKSKAEGFINEFNNNYPNGSGQIDVIEGNLNSLESTKQACEQTVNKYPVIDMIVNNAGIMNFERLETVDGIEETLQVNLISPLLICDLLYYSLEKSDDPKVIFTSSGLHQGEINFDNLEFNNNFSSFKVYRQSKLGVILICRLLAKKLAASKINTYSQHPGMVRTELGRSAGWFSKMIFFLMGSSPEKGAQTLSYLIEQPSFKLKNGAYYASNKVTKTTKQSYDLTVAEKLLSTVKNYLMKLDDLKSPIFN